MGNEDEALFYCKADRDFTLLSGGMVRVWKRGCKWVEEHGRSFMKRDAVLA